MRPFIFALFVLSMTGGFVQAGNPLVPDVGMADPHIRIFNGKPYLYATRDEDPNAKNFVMPDWNIWVSYDLVDWELARTIHPSETYMPESRWKECWAPDAETRNGKYYFYFSERAFSTGVMVSDSPTGPFVDALGKPLLDDLIPSGLEYDPSVFTDDDEARTPYIVFGRRMIDLGHDFYIAQLAEDMISLVPGSLSKIEFTGRYPSNDKPTLHKHGDLYYFSMGDIYATSENVRGPFTPRGQSGGRNEYGLGGQAHGNYFEWNNQWFHVWCWFMHGADVTRYRESLMTYVHYRRNGEMVSDTGFLDKHYATGVGQYGADWERIEAEWYMAADGCRKVDIPSSDGFQIGFVQAGGYLRFPNIHDIPENAEMTFRVSSVRQATIEVRKGAPDGPLLGSAKVTPTGGWTVFDEVSCSLVNTHGKKDLYLVFSGGTGNLLNLDWFRFAESGGTQPVSKSSLPPAIDPTTWALDSWRAWPFDYEELSAREAPLRIPGEADWIHSGDSWVAANEKRSDDSAPPVAADFENLKVSEFYLTGGGNRDGPNRIFCASAVPAGVEGPFPVLFVFHGGGGHASGALALNVARQNPGFAAVAVDYNGQYRPSNAPVTQWVTVTPELKERKHDLVPNPLNFPMYHYAQATRRVLDWTEQQSWADAEQFGAVGISYGGWLSFFLAGQDERIHSVYTAMSAAGTEGMRGNAAQQHDWVPREQTPIWIQHADPVAYAGRTQAPVFMRIAANDRFFWLDGAANHREALAGPSSWLVIPNSDHGNGGPDLPEPGGLWHRAVYADGIPLPAFGEVEVGNGTASVAVNAKRPLKSVYLAWSPGDAVSPARYWRWIEAREQSGLWAAELPEGHAEFQGTLYFTAIDADGRAASSDLLRKPGRSVGPALEWRNGCLWDIDAGADAWRSNLAFDKCRIENTEDGRVQVTPLKAGRKAAFFTNSFIVNEAAQKAHRGIRIELDGNEAAGTIRIMPTRDYTSRDERMVVAEVALDGERTEINLPWQHFKPYRAGGDVGTFAFNTLVFECENLPEEGIIIGTITWLN